MERVQDEVTTHAQKPCCDKKGLDKDEVRFLEHIQPEFKRLAEAFPNREVARRFAFSIDRDRPNLPPGKVLLHTRKTKVVDRKLLANFGGDYCCYINWETGECEYCPPDDWEHPWEGHKKALLVAAGAALAVYAACRVLVKDR